MFNHSFDDMTNDRFPKHWDLGERFKLYLSWMISLAHLCNMAYHEGRIRSLRRSRRRRKKRQKSEKNSKTRNFPKAQLQFSHVPTFSPKQALSPDRRCRSDWLRKLVGLSLAPPWQAPPPPLAIRGHRPNCRLQNKKIYFHIIREEELLILINFHPSLSENSPTL